MKYKPNFLEHLAVASEHCFRKIPAMTNYTKIKLLFFRLRILIFNIKLRIFILFKLLNTNNLSRHDRKICEDIMLNIDCCTRAYDFHKRFI